MFLHKYEPYEIIDLIDDFDDLNLAAFFVSE